MNKIATWLTWLFYLWLTAILIVSSIPDIGSKNETLLGFDKYAHFTEYFILSILFILMKIARKQKPLLKNYLLLAILLPMGDEIHQLFIRGREFSLLDFSADWAGASLAFLVYYLLKRSPLLKL
ncbi:MAG: VanZ family protein [Candidatus Cloacimonetes bacterium]|nr:VanZ family protein [Candidatus Cloacimonadota bacterium]